MVSILDLSNELLDRIIRAVAPSDLHALALSNKSIYALSKKCLERHLIRRKRYGVLRFGYREDYKQSYDNAGRDDTNDPISLLGSIIEDPSLTFYPNMIYLGHWIEEDGDADAIAKTEHIINKYCRELEIMIKTSEVIPEADKNLMFDAIRGPKGEGAAVCLLITILPNLTAIDTYWSGHNYASKLLAGLVQSVAISNQSGMSSSNNHALTNLQQITITHWDTEGAEDIENFGPFAMLPSLRRLYGSSIDGEGFSWPEGFRSSSSNITEINITNSAVDVEAFETLLSGISALQKFTYHHLGVTVGYASYNATGYVTALRKRASATLQLLDISAEEDNIEFDDDGEEEQRVGSLRDFAVLESIRLAMNAFQKPETDLDDEEPLDNGGFYTPEDEDNSGPGMERLIDVLPASIKTLTLVSSTQIKNPQSLFQGMAEMKAERVPKLNNITVEWGDPLDDETNLALRDVGITFKIYTGL